MVCIISSRPACKYTHLTPTGWSVDCLQEWGPFLKLAVPSMLMICLSWWLFEAGGFLAGLISEVELAAQSMAYQLCILAYMVNPLVCVNLSCRDYNVGIVQSDFD